MRKTSTRLSVRLSFAKFHLIILALRSKDTQVLGESVQTLVSLGDLTGFVYPWSYVLVFLKGAICKLKDIK
jgi:hypothetical protein